MANDPVLTLDEASGFYIERTELTVAGMSWVAYRAYPDERWVYHLHRGNHALGDTAEQAIADLARRVGRRIAA